MKRLLSVLLVACLLISLVACGNDKPNQENAPAEQPATDKPTEGAEPTKQEEAPEPSGEEIVIGVLQDITGPTSSLGQMVEAGAKWGADEINSAGGVDGRPIRLITYDTKGDINEAINAFTRAVTSDNVTAIIGPPVANIALAIAPVSEEYDVPILGFALDTKCQVKEDGTPYKNMFGFQPNADQQGAIIAKYAMENGFNSFGVIYNETNAYSVSLKEPFVDVVKQEGGSIDLEVPYTSNDKDFKTLLSKIIDQDVDAIFAPNYTQELILIVQQARALGYEGGLFCALDACPPFNTLLGESCENIYFINNVDDTEPQLQEMINQVKAETGIDATNKFFLGYDVINVLGETIEQVGDEPAVVRDAIEQLKDYQGLTGNITIDPSNHMPVGLEMVMFSYDDTTPIMLERYSA